MSFSTADTSRGLGTAQPCWNPSPPALMATKSMAPSGAGPASASWSSATACAWWHGTTRPAWGACRSGASDSSRTRSSPPGALRSPHTLPTCAGIARSGGRRVRPPRWFSLRTFIAKGLGRLVGGPAAPRRRGGEPAATQQAGSAGQNACSDRFVPTCRAERAPDLAGVGRPAVRRGIEPSRDQGAPGCSRAIRERRGACPASPMGAKFAP